MKKTLIAGAASLALAAMPVVGVFAVSDPSGTTITDTLEVEIATACSFLRWGEEGAPNQTDVETDPSWTGAVQADAPGDHVTGTYSAAILPTADVELGTSHFTAYCNVASGFDVTVETQNLTTTNNDSINYSGSAVNATSGQGWTLTLSDDSIFANSNNAKFMTADHSTDASSPVTETATYTVYTNSTTPAGTYTGNVIYTFTYTDPTI